MSALLERAAETASRHGATALEHIDYLDGWRGLAILFVLQEHFALIPRFETGRLGVDIFFCLSGLLMSRILFVKQVPLAMFYKRRVSRILPVFLVFVLGVYGVSGVAGHPGSWAELAATLAFLRTYVPGTPDIWSAGLPIGHLWSLNVEEHSYVILSLLTLVAAVRLRAGGLLIALGVAAVAMHLNYSHQAAPPPTYEIRTETAAAYLLLSAGYYLVRHHVAPFVKPWMPLAAFLLAVPCYWRGVPDSVEVVFTPFLLAFAVNHLSETAPWVRRALAVAPLRLMGICSYSIYLWQQPFFQFKAAFPPGVALAGAIATGFASFYLFENPVRTWLNRHW